MAKQPKAAPTAPTPSHLPPIVVELLHAELARCERQMRLGPSGAGWQYNEALKQPLEARIAALKEALTPPQE